MYSHVIVFVEAALQQNPVNQAELLFLRGKALSHFNRFADALVDYNQAVEYLSVSHVNYHLFLKPSELFMDRAIAHLELGMLLQNNSNMLCRSFYTSLSRL